VPPSPPPKTIGRYEVERLLGQGGMGRVWLARDTVLGRHVAVKVLRDDLALPPSVRAELDVRMRHEAQAAAAVSHPHIVTLHDMGEDDAVGLYLVFEYVAGPRADGPEALRDRLRDGPLPIADVARLARELGSALTFAHGAGVVHRDIKPENILFSRTGAKIADFGIARIPESTITRANTVLGTPAYTAPEALANGSFGPASDQFALAATLYEAATGKRAFGSDDPVVTAGKVSSEPPPPLDPGVGTANQVRSLGAALSRGLAKEAGARFGSCADLGEAVARGIERTETPSIDSLLEAASGTRRDGTASGQVEIEIERTPLSSRVALSERMALSELAARSDRAILTPYGESTNTRPSIMIRRRTHRFQNVMAGGALVVIAALVLFGRRQRAADVAATTHEPAKAAASISAALAASAHPAHPPTSKPHVVHASPRPTSSGVTSSSPAPSSAPPEAGDAGRESREGTHD